MIDLLDNLLRQILVSGIGGGFTSGQIGFQAPNADWRTVVNGINVGGNPANSLNVYLVDLRENRKLRSNERIRTAVNGLVTEDPAPARLDCHYLISAWSPVLPGGGILEPTLDEHALLYQVTRVLVQNGPLNPSRVYSSGSPQLNVWQDFQNADLPVAVLPVEGFHKLAEFWGGMGTGSLWKPAVYLIVTVPVALVREESGFMVTTTLTDHRITNELGTAEVLAQIGGQVLGPRRQLAVGNAGVTAVNVGGDPKVLTVTSAAAFVPGDIVTRSSARSTVATIAGNNVSLDVPLPGLAPGDTLRIANLPPGQFSVRLVDTSGLEPGTLMTLTGDDAAVPGAIVSEQVVIERIDSTTRFVMFRHLPARGKTLNMNVPAANAPALVAAARGAWVHLDAVTGARLQSAVTDEDGRFIFSRLQRGDYQLRAGANGFGPVSRAITVPSPTGEYDLQF